MSKAVTEAYDEDFNKFPFVGGLRGKMKWLNFQTGQALSQGREVQKREDEGH